MTDDVDTWFLLIQYRHRGETEVRTFRDSGSAAEAYGEAERKFKDKMRGSNPEMDVLLVGASSLDVVRRRYPSYFAQSKSKSDAAKRLLSGLVAVPSA
jgi:hypothetical protein